MPPGDKAAQRACYFADARDIAGDDGRFTPVGGGTRLSIQSASQVHDFAGIAAKQRVAVPDIALEKARKTARHIGAGNHQQIHAVFHFAQSGGEPAAILQRQHITHEISAVHVVHHCAYAVGDLHQRAHSRHISAQARDQRLFCFAENNRSRGRGIFKRSGFSCDARSNRFRGT